MLHPTRACTTASGIKRNTGAKWTTRIFYLSAVKRTGPSCPVFGFAPQSVSRRGRDKSTRALRRWRTPFVSSLMPKSRPPLPNSRKRQRNRGEIFFISVMPQRDEPRGVVKKYRIRTEVVIYFLSPFLVRRRWGGGKMNQRGYRREIIEFPASSGPSAARRLELSAGEHRSGRGSRRKGPPKSTRAARIVPRARLLTISPEILERGDDSPTARSRLLGTHLINEYE